MYEWDAAVAGPAHGLGHGPSDFTDGDLGQEYLLTDSGGLTAVTAAQSAHGAHGGSGGTGSGSPASTLVGSSTGLEINLQWDSSVQGASNWSAIEAAVVSAAKIYTSMFSTHAVVNVSVGLGEINGTRLGPGVLGESESLGYMTGYATVTGALQSADAGLVGSGLVASGAFTADSALSTANFFVTSAEAKALGLVSATGAGVDGYIGLASGSSLFYPASGGQIGSSQYDAVGVAAHELSEVMGRIGLVGGTLGSYSHVYTPLDLFRYSAPGVPAVSAGAGYFSTDLGATNLNTYNNPSNGGDASDWASLASNTLDAYSAFGHTGVTTTVTATDLLEDAVLGFNFAAGATPTTVQA